MIRLTREHPHWAGTKSVEWNQAVVSQYDAVLIATAHANVDYGQLVEWSQLVIDTRNATRKYLPSEKIVLA